MEASETFLFPNLPPSSKHHRNTVYLFTILISRFYAHKEQDTFAQQGMTLPIRMHAVAPPPQPPEAGASPAFFAISQSLEQHLAHIRCPVMKGGNNYALCLLSTPPSITLLLFSFCPSYPSTVLSSGAFQACSGQWYLTLTPRDVSGSWQPTPLFQVQALAL